MSKLWGKIKNAAMAGVKPWREHDARETWNSGDIDKLLEPLGETKDHLLDRLDGLRVQLRNDLDAHIADQVKEAVYEHARDGVWFMGMSKEGKLLVGIDVGNEVAPLLIKVSLLNLMNEALKEAYAKPSPDSASVVSGIKDFARKMAHLHGQIEKGAATPQREPMPKVISRGMPPTAEERALQ
jgi:hypothetical protein